MEIWSCPNRLKSGWQQRGKSKRLRLWTLRSSVRSNVRWWQTHGKIIQQPRETRSPRETRYKNLLPVEVERQIHLSIRNPVYPVFQNFFFPIRNRNPVEYQGNGKNDERTGNQGICREFVASPMMRSPVHRYMGSAIVCLHIKIIE